MSFYCSGVRLAGACRSCACSTVSSSGGTASACQWAESLQCSGTGSRGKLRKAGAVRLGTRCNASPARISAISSAIVWPPSPASRSTQVRT